MQLSQDIEKTIFPLKLIWFALSASLLVYAFVIYQTHGFSLIDLRESGSLKKTLLPFSYIPFLFTFFTFSKKNWILNKFFVKKKVSNAPYLKAMSEYDREYLAQFSPYMVFHILMWALNEMGAVIAFVVTFTSGNFTYYIINGSLALLFNLLLFKPNYKAFKRNLR